MHARYVLLKTRRFIILHPTGKQQMRRYSVRTLTEHRSGRFGDADEEHTIICVQCERVTEASAHAIFVFRELYLHVHI